MFSAHDVFEKPSDENAKIWRYLDFTKFVDLLDSSSLFFTRADHFEDRFEGSYPEYNVKMRPQVYQQQGLSIADKIASLMAKTAEHMPKHVAINCWHVNSHESAAMWRLYLKSDEGIAIQSTYARLGESFSDGPDQIHGGLVKYIDYEKEWMPEGNLFYPFTHKRLSFAHENEFRCVIVRFPSGEGETIDFSQGGIENGVRVPVDLGKLIEGIYVAPNSQSWFARLVEAVARKYGITAKITASSLGKDPVY